MTARQNFTLVWLLAVLLLVASVDSAWACPGCKDALAANDGGPQGDLVSGYFWSILFMMSMPFAIFGAFAASIYRAVRKARGEEAAAGECDPASADPDRTEVI